LAAEDPLELLALNQDQADQEVQLLMVVVVKELIQVLVQLQQLVVAMVVEEDLHHRETELIQVDQVVQAVELLHHIQVEVQHQQDQEEQEILLQ
jgi:hypothetical protein